jgi:formylglycine-generating enzyme required for sulfatase activity
MALTSRTIRIRRAAISLLIFGFFAWVAIELGLPGNIGLTFGYYGDLNTAKRAIAEPGCVEIYDVNAYRDFGLKAFTLFIRTRSDWQVELWFNHRMDVWSACYRPRGVLLYNPVKGEQIYSIERLSDLLPDKSVSLRTAKDILCHFDEVMAVFEANYDNDAIPSTKDYREYQDFKDYLRIDEIPHKPFPARASTLLTASAGLEASPKGTSRVVLHDFQFDVVRLNAKGIETERQKKQAKFFIEGLGSVTLDMVQIPGGTCLMGTSDTEVAKVIEGYSCLFGKDVSWAIKDIEEERPQHSVSVPSFFMGRFEVTQAQWRAVAQLPKVSRELNADPASQKGDDLPVENVSWDDAVEFCERLSRETGRQYRLPSEAEWEYACRAGTTTPFHFGETMTQEFGSVNWRYPYGEAHWGISPEEPAPVGYFGVANSFGLYDMHGNVREWCLDAGHKNYNGAPTDGRAWVENGNGDQREVRGGAFIGPSLYCRSASRLDVYHTRGRSDIGFRVVAIVPSGTN